MKKSADFWKMVILVLMALAFVAIGCKQIDVMEETQKELNTVREVIAEYNENQADFNEQWDNFFRQD